MKFTTREDIDAPLEDVFKAMSDFGTVERLAIRRGADVVRLDSLTEPAAGMSWKVTIPFRGNSREIDAEMVRFEKNDFFEAHASGSGLSSQFTMEFVALSPRTTRVAFALDIKPSTISARLFLQSARLAKTNLNQRFKAAIRRHAQEVEARLISDTAS